MIKTDNVDLTKYHERVSFYQTKFTNRYHWWSTAIGDHSALLYLSEKYKIQSFCEIGTWEGYTSLFMWLNSPATKQKAIDICENYSGVGSSRHHDLDKYGKYFVDITPVVLEVADTTKYQPKPEDEYDMVFVDGNHSYAYVKNDAQLAKKMSKRIIAFHDWNNTNKDVTKYLKEISNSVDIIEIPTSCIAYYEI